MTPHGFWRRAAPRLPHSAARRVLFLAVYALFLLGLVWVGLRVFWSVRAGVPITERPVIWDVFYPSFVARA